MGSLGILVGVFILLFVKEPERGRYQKKKVEIYTKSEIK
jgi:hypothetical protein